MIKDSLLALVPYIFFSNRGWNFKELLRNKFRFTEVELSFYPWLMVQVMNRLA
jgi:hypothetical protein